MVLAALDSFATFLTGQRYYLETLGGSGFIVPEPVDPDRVYDVLSNGATKVNRTRE